MLRQGTYADAMVISAAAAMLNIDIRLVSRHGAETISPPSDEQRTTFTLGYNVDKHFFACVPVTGKQGF